MVQSATEVIQFDTATPLSGNPRGPVPNRCVAVRNCNATVQARSAAVDDRNEPAHDSTTTAERRNGQQKSRIAAARKVLRNDGSGTRHAAFSSVARDRFTNRVPSESRKAVRPAQVHDAQCVAVLTAGGWSRQDRLYTPNAGTTNS